MQQPKRRTASAGVLVVDRPGGQLDLAHRQPLSWRPELTRPGGLEVLDGHTVVWRSAPAVGTSRIAELGEAKTGLVRGTLPDPPRGTWWLFGRTGGPGTIAMDGEGSG